jgi:holo-[acyl-carrier protein] synthase
MIVGLGIEWLDVPRFEAIERRFGERLRERLFTEGELAFASRRARGSESLAVRLAAKLAARRALGMRAVRWHDLEVVRAGGLRPELHLHGEASRVAARLGVTHVSVTLTHDAAACLGQVVLEARAPAGRTAAGRTSAGRTSAGETA